MPDQQELSSDKKVLEAQVCEQMNVISTLKSEMSQLKIGGGVAQQQLAEATQLRQQLQLQRQEAEAREKEVRDT